jgi:hypothetical protein
MMHETILSKRATLATEAHGIVCDLNDSPSDQVSLGLALLVERLAEGIVWRSSASEWVVRLRVHDAEATTVRAYGQQRFEVSLSEIELGRWFAFFLRYFRDGRAEVDHLHVDAEWDTGARCDFTLKVSEFQAPVSEGEARKRLGLA